MSAQSHVPRRAPLLKARAGRIRNPRVVLPPERHCVRIGNRPFAQTETCKRTRGSENSNKTACGEQSAGCANRVICQPMLQKVFAQPSSDFVMQRALWLVEKEENDVRLAENTGPAGSHKNHLSHHKSHIDV